MARALLAIGGALVLLLVAGAVLFWKRPLATMAFFGRRTLASAGLKKGFVPSPSGPQRVWSGGSGPTLVLLHGAGAEASNFAKAVPALLPGRRLVVPDLAGHGASAPAEGPLPMETLLDGLEAVLAKEPGKLTLAGNSLGAWLAALWAARHPERVERLVLVDGGPLRHRAEGLTLQPKSVAEARKVMDAVLYGGSIHPPDFVLADVVRVANAGPIARMSAEEAGMEKFLLEGKLDTLTTPVDLLWGAADRLVPLSYAERLLAELPAARLTTIEKCGHAPQVECPERFAAALRGVLAQAPPAPRSAAGGAR